MKKVENIDSCKNLVIQTHMWYFSLPPHKFWNVKLLQKKYSVENLFHLFVENDIYIYKDYCEKIYTQYVVRSWISYLRMHTYVNVISAAHNRIMEVNPIFIIKNLLVYLYSKVPINLVLQKMNIYAICKNWKFPLNIGLAIFSHIL